MTSDRHLALMTLMRELDEPSATYRRAVRLGAALATDSDDWHTAVNKGNTALDVIERIVRHWTATNSPQPIPGRCGTPSPDGRVACALEPHGDDELHADRPREDCSPSGQRMVWETPVTAPAAV